MTGIALVADMRSSIAGAIGAFLAFNFFFTTPYHTFFVANTHDVLALITFLGLSIIVSRLVVRARERTREALRHSRQTETLYQLSVALIRSNEVESVSASIAERVRRMFDLDRCAVLLVEGDGFRIGAATDDRIDASNGELLAAAQRALRERKTTGLGTRHPQLRSASRNDAPSGRRDHETLLVPILTADVPIGVLVVVRDYDRRSFDDEESRLLVTFANQAALAIERSQLTEERTRAEILSRTDELKSALLSAVSHDLRTPLASIKASATTLMQSGVNWNEADRIELLEAIDEETDRLNRLVTNLLDLSRIEAGALNLTRDWYEPAEVVNEVLDRSAHLLEGREVQLDLPAESTLIEIDFVMISEVLANLLENAVKYSPDGEKIRIAARKRDGMLEMRVEDRGAGIPPGEEEHIFDRFYRVEKHPRSSGSGMGLAICRGFVEAHGGRILAEPNPGGGTCFVFTVPLAGTEAFAEEPPERGMRQV